MINYMVDNNNINARTHAHTHIYGPYEIMKKKSSKRVMILVSCNWMTMFFFITMNNFFFGPSNRWHHQHHHSLMITQFIFHYTIPLFVSATNREKFDENKWMNDMEKKRNLDSVFSFLRQFSIEFKANGNSLTKK